MLFLLKIIIVKKREDEQNNINHVCVYIYRLKINNLLINNIMNEFSYKYKL